MTNTKIQPAVIGIFVVSSFFLLAAAVVLFGGKSFFNRENIVITYFEDSLQGLSVGAPVTYRGVTIGQVKEIKIHVGSDNEMDPDITIPVLISLSPGDSIILKDGRTRKETTTNAFLSSMCRQGLRAKLKTQSLVTGKLYIDLAIYENSTPVYRDKEGRYFEIPTLPSEMYQISQILGNMDFKELYDRAINTFNSLENLATNLDATLESAKSRELANLIGMAAADLQSILSQVNTKIPHLLDTADKSLGKVDQAAFHAEQTFALFSQKATVLTEDLAMAIQQINTTLKEADNLLAEANRVMHPDSRLYIRLTSALHQVEKTADSIQDLSDFLHRNPQSLVYGLADPENN